MTNNNAKLFKDLKNLAKNCNNLPKTLHKNMEDKVSSQLLAIGDKVVTELKNYILSEWYNQYEPKDYYRTYSLIDALRFRVNGSKLSIYYDMRRFKRATFSDNFDNTSWKPYVTFEGNDFKYGMVDFMTESTGILGGANSNPRRSDKSLNIKAKAEELINKYTADLDAKFNFDFLIKDKIFEGEEG